MKEFKKGDKVICTHSVPESFTGGTWIYKTREFEVRVMAIAEEYAMVRRKRAMPFVVNVKDLL